MPSAPASAPITHLLYLHGFRSSPQSFKAQTLQRRVQSQHPSVTWWCPTLPASPQQAMAQVLAGVAAWPRQQMAIVGSSLGGFYATVLSQQLACPAVLLNPAVFPARDLARHIGVHPAWHQPCEKVFFEAAFVQELAQLEGLTFAERVPAPRRLVLIAKGDEVLDWREMAARHQGAQLRLLPGGDHALSDFEQHLPEILEFLGLA